MYGPFGGRHERRVKSARLGDERGYVAPSDDEQSALLRRLVVEEGRDVVEFVEESGGLEQLFMSLTEGIVQ